MDRPPFDVSAFFESDEGKECMARYEALPEEAKRALIAFAAKKAHRFLVLALTETKLAH